MSQRYRIVYFVPDPFLEQRVAVGALLDAPGGLRVASAEFLPGAQCLGSEGASVALRAVADALHEVGSYGSLPPWFSPQAVFGKELALPAGVDDGVAFLTEHVLPRATSGKRTQVTQSPRRDVEGRRFFDNWQVGQHVHGHFKPVEFMRATQPSAMLGAVPDITHYVVGHSELLLMEPIAAGRPDVKKETKEVVGRFLAYETLLTRGLLKPAHLIAYVLPCENAARVAEVVEALRGAASQVVNVGRPGEREAFVKRVRTTGESGGLLSMH